MAKKGKNKQQKGKQLPTQTKKKTNEAEIALPLVNPASSTAMAVLEPPVKTIANGRQQLVAPAVKAEEPKLQVTPPANGRQMIQVEATPPVKLEIQNPRNRPAEVKPEVKTPSKPRGVIVSNERDEKGRPTFTKIALLEGNRTLLQYHKNVTNPVIIEPGTLVEFELYDFRNTQGCKDVVAVGEHAASKELLGMIQKETKIKKVHLNDLITLLIGGKSPAEIAKGIVGVDKDGDIFVLND